MSALDDLLQSRGIGSPGTKPAVGRVSKGPPVPPKTPGRDERGEGFAGEIPDTKASTPIIHDCIQGTPEWAQLRCGIPTASQFHRIVTPGGKASKSAEMYRLELLAERLTGEPTVGFTSHWMDRGSELEAEAIAYYSFQRDCETVKVGFVTNAAGTIGASPDSLVGDDGLLEIKIGKPATQMGYLLQDSAAYEDYKIQAQAQLWVTQREWNDLLAYNPMMPPALYRVERDENFIADIAREVMAFSAKLEEQFLVCLERGWVKERRKPEPQREKREPLPPLTELVKSALIEMNK